LFEDAIDIKNAFIQVTTIEKIYSQPYLDEGIGVLKDMRDLLISICGMQKQMLGKQDETLFEIKDMNHSLNDKMDKVLDKSEIIELKGDVSEMKSALRAKGII
jgi:hypothetical protein